MFKFTTPSIFITTLTFLTLFCNHSCNHNTPSSNTTPTLPPADNTQIAAEMHTTARQLIASLDPALKQKLLLPFDQDRKNWGYIPMPRKGISLKELQPEQIQLADALLASALSSSGIIQAKNIITLEKVLWHQEQGKANVARRDPEKYHLMIFGNPEDKNWAWRFEGHHLSLHFTIIDNREIIFTPNFWGANPGEVTTGSQKGLRPLASTTDAAFTLLNSLSTQQKKHAISSEKTPRDILTKPGKKLTERLADWHTLHTGISFAELDTEQQAILKKIIHTFLLRYRPTLADQEWNTLLKLEDNLTSIKFLWIGNAEINKRHYFRITGNHFLIEYDDVSGKGSHIHSIYRRKGADFGEDLLEKHYHQSHHP